MILIKGVVASCNRRFESKIVSKQTLCFDIEDWCCCVYNYRIRQWSLRSEIFLHSRLLLFPRHQYLHVIHVCANGMKRQKDLIGLRDGSIFARAQGGGHPRLEVE